VLHLHEKCDMAMDRLGLCILWIRVQLGVNYRYGYTCILLVNWLIKTAHNFDN